MKIASTMMMVVVVLAAACSDDPAGDNGAAGNGGIGGTAGTAGGTSGTGVAGTGTSGTGGQAGSMSSDAGIDAMAAVDCSAAPAGPGPVGAGNRYDGLSEAQMFIVTQDSLCATVVRCPALADETSIDLATCRMQLDDMQNYASAIDATQRSALDACIDDFERASCCDLVENDFPQSCATVEDLLDIK